MSTIDELAKISPEFKEIQSLRTTLDAKIKKFNGAGFTAAETKALALRDAFEAADTAFLYAYREKKSHTLARVKRMVTAFKKSYTAGIEAAKDELSQHRGWPGFFNSITLAISNMFASLFGFKTSSAVMLEKMGASLENIKEKNIPYEDLNNLPAEMTREIASFLTREEEKNVVLAAKNLYTDVQPQRLQNAFCSHVAKGNQNTAEEMRAKHPNLLSGVGTFTDYSGRTFTCTAYEYAYWAKDKHMRRMLERNMDNDTAAKMLKRIDEIERTGLAYEQHGKQYQNPHYDMSFAFSALSANEFKDVQDFIIQNHERIVEERVAQYTLMRMPEVVINEERDEIKKTIEKIQNASDVNYKNIAVTSNIIALIQTALPSALNTKLVCDFNSVITALQVMITALHQYRLGANNLPARKAALMQVGLAQRDSPIHVINEYCRHDRPFYPLPAFNEGTLPRDKKYYNYDTRRTIELFPLVVSDSSGLGVDFSLERGDSKFDGEATRVGGWSLYDLAAVSHLDVVRTADLTLSRENLQRTDPALAHGSQPS